jgi:DNA repair exonuclease SbcCD ATPase subunit
MTKHDTQITPAKESDADFEARVESAILKLRAENDGKMPTNKELNELVRTSFRKLCPARRKVAERLLAVDTRLAQMPEIPEELRLANEEALKAMWAKTRELQNDEIVDLKRLMQARQEEHRNTTEDLEAIIASLEDNLEEAKAKASDDEKTIDELRAELEDVTGRLNDAEARLAERENLMHMLKDFMSDSDGGQEKPARKRQSNKANDDPELPLK